MTTRRRDASESPMSGPRSSSVYIRKIIPQGLQYVDPCGSIAPAWIWTKKEIHEENISDQPGHISDGTRSAQEREMIPLIGSGILVIRLRVFLLPEISN